jgi:hypothetical protein
MMWSKLKSDVEKEVEEERSELQKILKIDGERLNDLRKLALKVGASTVKLHPGYGNASEPELIQNIHQALQTKSMIAAVKTSNKHVIVSIILALIALGSTIAAFIAACGKT